jgi:amino acid adenylation domain-containing protein
VQQCLHSLTFTPVALQVLTSLRASKQTTLVDTAVNSEPAQSHTVINGTQGDIPAAESLTQSSEAGSSVSLHVTGSESPSAYGDLGYVSEGGRPRPRASKRQTSLWYTAASFDAPTMYNCSWVYTIQGRVDHRRFERAARLGCQRHETMRTAFNVEDDTGELVQDILPTSNHEWTYVLMDDQSDLDRAIARVEHQVYDLKAGKTSTLVLCVLSEQVHYLIVGYHHIILDGTGWQIVLRDIASMYDSGAVLPPAKIQYSDYVLHGETESDDHRAFWKAQFATVPSPLPLLPFAKTWYRHPLPAPSVHTFDTMVLRYITNQIKVACRKVGVTGMHFHASILQLMLSRLVGIREMCIGIGDANRHDNRYGDVAGLLTNLLPLRLVLESGMTLAQLAGQARETVLAAMHHSQVSFDTMIDDIGVERSSSLTPLFQVMINYISGFSDQIELKDASMKHYYAAEATHAQDLVLTIRETGEETRLCFTVQESLYSLDHAQLIAEMYLGLLEHYLANYEEPVDAFDFLKSGWRDQGRRLGQGPTVSPPGFESLYDLIADQAGQHPSNIAAKDDQPRAISYSKLMDRVRDIGATIETCGGSRDVAICIMGYQTIDVLCAIVAVWKLGAIYVPIDTSNPHERAKTMMENCAATIAFVCGEEAMTMGNETGVHTIITAQLQVFGPKNETPAISIPANTAAILHTSGTTGEPKGVILTHDNFLTQIAVVQQRYPLSQPRVLQQSGHSFDASLFQMLMSFSTGGTLVMTACRHDPEAVAKIICNERITTTLAVPSEYQMWFQHATGLSTASHWRMAFCGCEAMTLNVARGFAALNLEKLELVNAYGPTEASISCCMGMVDYHAEDPQLSVIGSALPNYDVSVVDEHGRPLPAGWTGEICIRGTGVGLGYVNVPIPPQSSSELQKSYMTGDMGRMSNEGNFLFMGRIDAGSYQKIRGNRVEPLEISNAILKASKGDIAECAVILKGEDSPFLVAYVAFANDRYIEAQEEYLLRLKDILMLPSYMRPMMILPVAVLPKTINGKVDTNASITMIVHNGAAVSFLQPYASLRAANVTSTKELIRLAASRRIPLHYVSTAGVAELTNLLALREVSVAEYIPPVGASGNTTSKWASEVVLEKASAKFEIPVTIHRPTSVVKAAGKPDEVPLHDALQNLLRFSREMKAVPRLEG